MRATDEQPFQGSGCWTCLTQGSSSLATLVYFDDAFGIGIESKQLLQLLQLLQRSKRRASRSIRYAEGIATLGLPITAWNPEGVPEGFAFFGLRAACCRFRGASLLASKFDRFSRHFIHTLGGSAVWLLFVRALRAGAVRALKARARRILRNRDVRKQTASQSSAGAGGRGGAPDIKPEDEVKQISVVLNEEQKEHRNFARTRAGLQYGLELIFLVEKIAETISFNDGKVEIPRAEALGQGVHHTIAER